MNNMNKILNSVKVLKGWDGMDVLTMIDEDPKDIWMMVLYDEHGDDFLVVRTLDGKTYKYACYANRLMDHYDYDYDYDCLCYERKPKLYKKFDEHSEVSNAIYREFNWAFRTDGRFSFGYDKVYPSKQYAQMKFDEEMKYISNLAETTDVIFDWDEHKSDMQYWLERNGIATDENIAKLKSTKFDSKVEVDGHKVIGIAGKLNISCENWLFMDGATFIFVNGKNIDPKKVLVYDGTDEWGIDSYRLNLKGFRPSKARV